MQHSNVTPVWDAVGQTWTTEPTQNQLAGNTDLFITVTRPEGTQIFIRRDCEGAYSLQDSRISTPVLGLNAEELTAYLRESDIAIEVL